MFFAFLLGFYRGISGHMAVISKVFSCEAAEGEDI